MSTVGKVLTNDRLKAIMTDALANRGKCTDVDAAYAAGIYNMDDNTAGIQGFDNAQYGVLIVIAQGTNIWFQCIIPWVCNYLLMRSGNKIGWQPWKKVTLTASLSGGGNLLPHIAERRCAA